MTTPINDGGPAFPCDPFIASKPGNEAAAKRLAEGMSLRDHFAAQVIGPAFLDLFDGWRKNGEPVQEDWPMGLAIDAYRVADAMLRVRSQGEPDA